MKRMARIFGRKISTDAFDVRCAQSLCFAAGTFILAAGSWKLTTLDVSIIEAVFGLLLTAIVALLCVVLGLMLPIAHAAMRTDSPSPRQD